MSGKVKYFWQKAPGLNADIERHREEEIRLREELRKAKEIKDDVRIRIYMCFLDILLQSKAELTSQIGKKNK